MDTHQLSPYDVLNSISNPRLQADAWELCDLMKEVTGHEPIMWGPSVIGFGQTSGAERPMSAMDGLEVGFSTRGTKLVLILRRYAEHYREILARVGEVQSGKVAITIDSLEGVNRAVLRELIEFAWHDRSRAEDES